MTKIAVPLIGGNFSSHFGGAESFALYGIDEETRSIATKDMAIPPPHEPGTFPTWLRSQGATIILAGGMGPRAVQMFQSFGIDVVMGIEAPVNPDELARAYLDGTLQSTGKGCGGGDLHHCHDHKDA